MIRVVIILYRCVCRLLGLIDSIYSTRQLRNQGVRGCEEGGIMKQLQQVADELV